MVAQHRRDPGRHRSQDSGIRDPARGGDFVGGECTRRAGTVPGPSVSSDTGSGCPSWSPNQVATPNDP
jgi:hypothetical protein